VSRVLARHRDAGHEAQHPDRQIHHPNAKCNLSRAVRVHYSATFPRYWSAATGGAPADAERPARAAYAIGRGGDEGRPGGPPFPCLAIATADRDRAAAWQRLCGEAADARGDAPLDVRVTTWGTPLGGWAHDLLHGQEGDCATARRLARRPAVRARGTVDGDACGRLPRLVGNLSAGTEAMAATAATARDIPGQP
jgi:hypothetical protein